MLHPTFEEAWSDLSTRLDAALVRRGVPPWLKDDAVQETGLRLLKMWDDLDHDRPLLPLAYTIARNLVTDEIRRNRNVDVGEDIDKASDEFVTERAGLARIELREIEQALPALTEKQRSVVLSDLGVGPLPKMGPDAIKMARMRARRSLVALLAGAGRFHTGVVVNFRRLTQSVEVATATKDGSTMVAGALVAAAMLATGPWSPPAATSPRAETTPTEAPLSSPARAAGAESARVALRSSRSESGRDAGGKSTPSKAAGAPGGDERTDDSEEQDEPALAVGDNEARAGAGVRVLGGGTHVGNDGENDVVLCADEDRFNAGLIGDPSCNGRVVSVEVRAEITTGSLTRKSASLSPR